MANTLLYYDLRKNMYFLHRDWDGGQGFLNSGSSSMKGLAAIMKESTRLFREPFVPKGGIPECEEGNEYYRVLRPLSVLEVLQVRANLRGQVGFNPREPLA